MKIIGLLWVALLLLCSCGDDFYAGNESQQLTQHVFMTPESYNGDPSAFFELTDGIVLDQGKTVKFVAAYSIKPGSLVNDSLEKLYAGMLWEVDGKKFNNTTFRYTFEEAGIKHGFLETYDFYGDTLRTDFDVYVNAPSSITLDFPYNGYNQVDIGREEVPLRWTVSGIDEWETATCEVFFTESRESIWTQAVDTIDCNQKVSLRSPKTGYEDSTLTTYWGVVATINSEGRILSDTSEVYHFSTKLANTENSIIRIPIRYSQLRSEDFLLTVITIVSASGDTLASHISTRKSTSVDIPVKPQAGLRIYISEKILTEYSEDSITVDVPSRTMLELDTIVLVDKVSPQAAPVKEDQLKKLPVQFHVSDKGAGINPSKLFFVIDGDTIPHTYGNSLASFFTSCSDKCKLQVLGEDYARNKLPATYWNISSEQDSLHITGPFISEEF